MQTNETETQTTPQVETGTVKQVYAKIERSDADGSYIEKLENLPVCIQGESDCAEPGESITITFVEMTEEEYAALPEFMGW